MQGFIRARPHRLLSYTAHTASNLFFCARPFVAISIHTFHSLRKHYFFFLLRSTCRGFEAFRPFCPLGSSATANQSIARVLKANRSSCLSPPPPASFHHPHNFTPPVVPAGTRGATRQLFFSVLQNPFATFAVLFCDLLSFFAIAHSFVAELWFFTLSPEAS